MVELLAAEVQLTDDELPRIVFRIARFADEPSTRLALLRARAWVSNMRE